MMPTSKDLVKTGPKKGATIAAAMVAVVFLVFFLANVLLQVHSHDVWWHLHLGRWIAEHHSIPKTDHLTLLGEGRPYVDSHWLFQLSLYGMTRLFGLKGISLLQALLYGLMILPALLLTGEDRLQGITRNAWIAALGVLALSNRFLPRPELVTYLSITTLLLIFERERERPGRAIYAVPLIMLVWVNSHALYVIGYFLLCIYLLETLVPERFGGIKPKRHFRRRLVVFLLSLAVFFLNPHGLDLLRYSWLLATEVGREASPLMKSLGELAPTFTRENLRTAPMISFLLLTGLAVMGPVTPKGRIAFAPTIILSVLLLLSLTGERNTALFVSAALPMTILYYQRRRKETAFPVTVCMAVLFILLASFQSYRLVTNRYYSAQGVLKRFGLGVLEASVPGGVTDYLREYRPSGNLGHFDPHGGYYMYRLSPDYRPLFDGRWEIYDQAHLFDLYRSLSRPADYLRKLASYGIDLYAVDHRLAMNRHLLLYLYRSPDWKLVFADGRSALFLRKTPAHEPFPSLDAEVLARSVVINDRTMVQQDPQGVMNLLIFLEEKEAAMAVASRILDVAPGEGQVAKIYTDFLITAGRIPEAEAVIDGAIGGGGGSAALFSQRAFLRMEQKDLEGALAAMEEAVKLRPGNAGDHFNLALLYLEKGEVNKAKMEVQQVDRLDSGYRGLAAVREKIAVMERNIP